MKKRNKIPTPQHQLTFGNNFLFSVHVPTVFCFFKVPLYVCGHGGDAVMLPFYDPDPAWCTNRFEVNGMYMSSYAETIRGGLHQIWRGGGGGTRGMRQAYP